MNVQMYHNDKNNKTSFRAQVNDALAAWNNTTSGLFDRMFCCAYNGHQVYEEAAEVDFDVTSTDDFLSVVADNSDQRAEKSPKAADSSDGPDLNTIRQKQSQFHAQQHQLLQQHYIFLEKKVEKFPSIKQIGRTKSFDDDEDDDAASIRTATTASMNTRSSQSLNTMPTMISSATSVTSSSITRPVGNHRSLSTTKKLSSRPHEISVPYSDSRQQQQKSNRKKQQSTYRGSDSPRDDVAEIRRMQSESLADLPYLTVTEGYRC